MKKELGEGFKVMSAGLGALVDHPAHEISQKIALQHGIEVYCYFPYKHKLSMSEDYIAGEAAGIRY